MRFQHRDRRASASRAARPACPSRAATSSARTRSCDHRRGEFPDPPHDPESIGQHSWLDDLRDCVERQSSVRNIHRQHAKGTSTHWLTQRPLRAITVRGCIGCVTLCKTAHTYLYLREGPRLSHDSDSSYLLIALILFALPAVAQIAGRNVNMVSGTTVAGWRPLPATPERTLARRLLAQPRPTFLAAPTTTAPSICPACPTAKPATPGSAVFKSYDGGQTWRSTIHPGLPAEGRRLRWRAPAEGLHRPAPTRWSAPEPTACSTSPASPSPATRPRRAWSSSPASSTTTTKRTATPSSTSTPSRWRSGNDTPVRG